MKKFIFLNRGMLTLMVLILDVVFLTFCFYNPKIYSQLQAGNLNIFLKFMGLGFMGKKEANMKKKRKIMNNHWKKQLH